MPRFVPHNSAIALVIAPAVWLAYFVLTFLASSIGCARGWPGAATHGLGPLQVVLWIIAATGLALIGYASWCSWQNLRFARDPEEPTEPQLRERWEFLARAGLFLCGISLLGTLWGAINIVVFSAC